MKRSYATAVVLLNLAVFFPLQGQEAEREEQAEKPAIKRIGDTRFRLGDVEFDAQTRRIDIPVIVNMREGGPMEYILVHENGKTHESILTTTARPLHVQIVLELLRYASGHGDVFNRLLPDELLEAEGGDEQGRGDAVDVAVQWEEQDDEHPIAAAPLVIDRQRAEPMSVEPWILTGSLSENGVFLAEAEGSIIAVYLDRFALFNMTREGAEIDERWGANGAAIPPVGTRGKIVIGPRDAVIDTSSTED